MKRLFAIKDIHIGELFSHSHFFETKSEAKKTRDALNGYPTSETTKNKFVVTLGPDHRNYKG